MSNGLFQLVVAVPEEGNKFVKSSQVFKKTENDTDTFLHLRITDGHTFISGYKEYVLFDGTMTFECRVVDQYSCQTEISQEDFEALATRFRQIFPEKIIEQDFANKSISMNLIESMKVYASETSLNQLSNLEEQLLLPKKSLVDQAKWQRVEH